MSLRFAYADTASSTRRVAQQVLLKFKISGAKTPPGHRLGNRLCPAAIQQLNKN
ncbi:hypothetical protein BH11BAC3_BH11BAC3_23770 [soil metagenome]